MKRIVIIVLAGLFILPAYSQHPPQDKNWETVFQDSFNTFNSNFWRKERQVHGTYEYNNPEKRREYYSVASPDNAYVENDKLVLRTMAQTIPCPKGNGFLNCQYGGTHDRTSASIVSNARYKYGYYEIYAKLPASDGYHDSFWFWDQSPSTQTSNCWYNEIDVFEASGCKPNVVTGGVHYGFDCPADCEVEAGGDAQSANNYSNIYHRYGVEWNSDKITWYIDRNIVRQLPNNMGGIGIQNPMYIILSASLDPLTGSCPPDEDNTILPNYMYVDQINAYRLKCDKNTVVNEIYNFNKFYYAVKKSITLSGATTLPANSNISLRATDFIELKDGFEVPLGTELFLDINPCEITGATPQTQLD